MDIGSVKVAEVKSCDISVSISQLKNPFCRKKQCNVTGHSVLQGNVIEQLHIDVFPLVSSQYIQLYAVYVCMLHNKSIASHIWRCLFVRFIKRHSLLQSAVIKPVQPVPSLKHQIDSFHSICYVVGNCHDFLSVKVIASLCHEVFSLNKEEQHLLHQLHLKATKFCVVLKSPILSEDFCWKYISLQQ